LTPLSSNRLKRLLLWAPPCTYMGVLFFASSMPGDELPSHMWDKLAHLLAYAVLGILFLLPLCRGRLLQIRGATAAMAVLLTTLYGAFDEVHQAFTPDRSPDVRDLIADCLGATVGVAAILLLVSIIRRLRGAASRLTTG
jgi:VanZ family protein